MNCNKRKKNKVIRLIIRISGRKMKKPLNPHYEMEKKEKIKIL
jgi:hypothetical protein